MQLKQVLVAIVACTAVRGESEAEWYTCPKSPQDAYFHFYTPRFGDQETSVQVYETARWDQLNWNCVAAMSATYLDSYTSADPVLRAPEGYHTARHRVSCTFFALYETLPGFMPDMVEKHATEMAEWGYADYTSVDRRREVRKCLDNGDFAQSCLQIILGGIMDNGGHPLEVASVLGSMVGHLHSDMMKNDGMNANGMMGTKGRKCTKNCWRYRDTTGYSPVNGATMLLDDTRWQPLVETDGNGFFYAQEHVTPQVGNLEALTVPAEFLERTVDPPNYNYTALDMDPVEAVAALDGDIEKKMLIEYLDAKAQILVDIGVSLDLWMGFSYEEKALWLNGYTSVEIDAVAVTWKEKVRHDSIRPTSRVQQSDNFMGPDQVKWYDGSMVDKEDWTPYIRVMPHAEYPSGSASICWSIQEYVDAWARDNLGQESIEVTKTFKAKSSHVDPSLPEEEFSYTFKNMMEVAALCSESRLWGGMHYRPSIEASVKLVEGFGATAYEWTKRLRNSEELPGILPEDMPEDPEPEEPKRCGHNGRIKKAKSLDFLKVRSSCECRDYCAALDMKDVMAWSSTEWGSRLDDGPDEKKVKCTCFGQSKKATMTTPANTRQSLILSGFL